MIFVAVPELIAGLIATGGATKLAVGLFVGALVGSVIYNAVFVMISVLTTRAIAVGLLYVLVWEARAGQPRQRRPGCCRSEQYSLGVANSIAHDTGLNARAWAADGGRDGRGGDGRHPGRSPSGSLAVVLAQG